jgi:hypothetical protein
VRVIPRDAWNNTHIDTHLDLNGSRTMTPPVLVYLGMGFIVARIMLDGKQTRGYTWLQWLQYLVDAGRIILLWPLVLLVEKVVAWLKTDVPPPAGVKNTLPAKNSYTAESTGEER